MIAKDTYILVFFVCDLLHARYLRFRFAALHLNNELTSLLSGLCDFLDFFLKFNKLFINALIGGEYAASMEYGVECGVIGEIGIIDYR